MAGRAATLAAIGIALVLTAPAQAADGTWQQAWGKNVNGGGAFGVCTAALSCQAGTTSGLGGELYWPQGVATDADGDLYVADTANQRIQKFADPAAAMPEEPGTAGGRADQPVPVARAPRTRCARCFATS